MQSTRAKGLSAVPAAGGVYAVIRTQMSGILCSALSLYRPQGQGHDLAGQLQFAGRPLATQVGVCSSGTDVQGEATCRHWRPGPPRLQILLLGPWGNSVARCEHAGAALCTMLCRVPAMPHVHARTGAAMRKQLAILVHSSAQ